MKRLDEHFVFLNVDATHWSNLLSALPFFPLERGAIYLLYREREITHAVHTRQGLRLDLKGPFTSPTQTLQQLQEQLEVDAAIMIEEGLAAFLLAKVQAMFLPDMDILQFLEIAYQSLAEDLGRRFHVQPRDFWNRSGLAFIQRIRALLSGLPNDAHCIMVIFRENTIWTSLIVEIIEGKIQRITTTDQLEPFELTITNWRKDYRKIIEHVDKRMGHPTIGFFTDVETFRFLLRSESPIEFIRQARRKEQIILDPLPFRLRGRV